MRTLITFVAVLGTTLGLGAVQAEQLQAALSATVEVEDLSGRALADVDPGVPFRIRVTLENLVGADAPAGLFLGGWLRPISARNIGCTEAARAYMATNRIPTNAIDLNGAVVAVLGVNQSLTLVDPDLNLATANLIGAATFASPPAEIVADSGSSRFLLPLPNEGKVVAIAAFGGNTQVVAEGLDQPSKVYPTGGGGFWVQERSRLALVGQDDVMFDTTYAHGEEGELFLAAWGRGEVHILDGEGVQVLKLDEPVGLADAVPLTEDGNLSGVALLANDALTVRYADAPNMPVRIPLTGAAKRLSPDASGRWVFAWTPGVSQPVEIIDLARGHVAQAIGATTAISEIRFSEGSAYLMMADHSKVGAIDLSTIRRGVAAQVREIALGGGSGTRSGETLLLPLPGQAEFMAIHPDTFTGFLIHDYSVMGDAPPMSAVRLRGGVPLAAAALDRGFREIRTGMFETVVNVPDDTPYELVVSTGIGSLSLCFPLPGTGQTKAGRGVGRISVTAGEEGVRLVFRAADGQPAPAEGVVSFSALMTGWRRTVTFRTDEHGESIQTYVLPDIGPVSVSVRTKTGQEYLPTVTGAQP